MSIRIKASIKAWVWIVLFSVILLLVTAGLIAVDKTTPM